MPDIISARCFGCGHVIKVPSALGGKKARCPQCTNTIAIPTPADTTEELVSDADLPEVARDDQVVNGRIAEDFDEPVVEGEPVEDPSEMRRRGAAGARRGSSAQNTRVGGRGTGGRYAPAGGKKSSAGLIVGIAVAVLAVIVIAVALSGGPKPKEGKSAVGPEQPPKEEPLSTADQDLMTRCLDYALAVNSADPNKILRFYAFEPEEQGAMLRLVNQLVDQKPSYDSPAGKSASAATGVATFTHSGGREKSITWKQVNGTWLIAEKPSP